MKSIKFSIIVPCYNVELYIDECMQSILNQSYNNYEVIIIDDGSTDHTNEKCKNWCKIDERVKLITQKNGGLSAARNTGIEAAEGSYLVFVDSDDTIEKDSLLHFSNALLDGTDILITRLAECYPNYVKECDKALIQMDGQCLNKSDAIDWIMNKSECTWPSVKNIVSRSFVIDHSLKFSNNILHEDFEWTAKIYCAAKKFSCCSYLWYNHRMGRIGSITKVVSYKHITDVIDMAYSFMEGDNHFYCEQLDDNQKNWMTTRMMRSVYASLSYYKELTAKDKTLVIECIKNHRNIFCSAPCFRHKIFRDVMFLLGVQPAMALYELLA